MNSKFSPEESPMTAEDLQNHYVGLLTEVAQRQGDRIDKNTLTMFCLASLAQNLEYIELRLFEIQKLLEKALCRKS